MKKVQNRNKALQHTALIMALASGTFWLTTGHAWAGQDAAYKAVSMTTLVGINIEYKMDPRIQRGLYMGDRWITPPTYTTTLESVEIRANGVDTYGAPITIKPQWIPSDPEMVTVSPSQGKEVKITVKRAGESKLQVTSQGVTKELIIKAVPNGSALQVEIAQIETQPKVSKAVVVQDTKASKSEDIQAFKSEKDRLSYAVGANFGTSIRKQSLDVDSDVLIQGIKDALSGGKMLMTDAQMRAMLLARQEEVKKKQTAKNMDLGEKNKKEGEAFLAENKAKEGVVTLESGLQYKILKAGNGNKPTAADTVVCHYRGTLINGQEFDSSYKNNQPATLALNKVIQGWREALQLMPVGSRWQIIIPSSLAYGTRPAGKIGPNSTLIFEVELVSIQGKS